MGAKSYRLTFFLSSFPIAVAALITKKPSSVIVQEGDNLNLVCKASGLPVPTITWQKPLGHLPRGKTTVIGWEHDYTTCNERR